MPSTSKGATSTFSHVTLLLFFVSGATSLVYEVVWMRRLSLVFGHSIFSVATVLTTFMSGLALGSYLCGFWSDRQRKAGKTPSFFLKTYGHLELFIGLWALGSIFLLNGVEAGFLSLARSGIGDFSLKALTFVSSFLVLLPPTTAMGATLPVFTQALVLRRADTGDYLARIYGTNTLGACLGAGLGGLVLLPNLGGLASILLTAILNALIAATAYGMAKSAVNAVPAVSEPTSESGQESESVEAPHPPGYRWVPLVFGLSGFAGMTYQVGWTRALVLAIGSSTYSFSIILTTFLASLGLGSLLYKLLYSRRLPKIRDLAVLQLLICSSALVVSQLMDELPILKYQLINQLEGSFTKIILADTILVFFLLLIPALALGLTFPLVTHLYTSKMSELGQRLGQAYSANTTGAILGSFLSGFVMLPQLGLQNTIAVAALMNLVGGLLLYISNGGPSKRLRIEPALVVLTLLVMAFSPGWQLNVMSSGLSLGYAKNKIRANPIFYVDGVTSTVTVGLNKGHYPYLSVNGKFDASLEVHDRRTQLLLGLVPLSIHPAPRDVAVVGFGSGQTLVGLLGDPNVKTATCAELEPAVIEAGKFFAPFCEEVLSDPRITLVKDDGRSFVLGSDTKYDIIVNEPSNPWVAGVANLFTKEFYEGCREQLKPGGIMCQWFQYYAMGEEEVQMVYRTFYSVFPAGDVYRTNSGDLIMIGGLEKSEMTAERLEEVYSQDFMSAFWFQSIGLFSPGMLRGTYLASRDEIITYLDEKAGGFSEGVLNTDDLPVLEYQAPKNIYKSERHADAAYEDFVEILPGELKNNAAKVAAAIAGRLTLRVKFDRALAKSQLEQAISGKASWFESLILLQLSEQSRESTALNALASEIPEETPDWQLLALSKFLKDREQFDVLERVYSRLLKSSPPGSEYRVVSEAAEISSNPERARELWLRATKLTKGDNPFFEAASIGPVESWDEDLLKKAVSINPYSGRNRYLLARKYVASGKADLALEQALESHRLDPLNPGTAQILVDLFKSKGDADKALHYAAIFRQITALLEAQTGRKEWRGLF